MAKHTYQLVHLPKRFPDTFVLLTQSDGSYAVRVYSESNVKRYDSGHFGISYRDLLKEATVRKTYDAHRTGDVAHWWTLIRRLNRTIGGQ